MQSSRYQGEASNCRGGKSFYVVGKEGKGANGRKTKERNREIALPRVDSTGVDSTNNSISCSQPVKSPRPHEISAKKENARDVRLIKAIRNPLFPC